MVAGKLNMLFQFRCTGFYLSSKASSRWDYYRSFRLSSFSFFKYFIMEVALLFCMFMFHKLSYFSFFKKYLCICLSIYLSIYLSIWLCRVLVAACGVFFLAVARELLIVACMWDLVPWPGIKPGPPALGAQSLSHWTSREVPMLLFKAKRNWGFDLFK